eukprot:SAG31_NODE_672_length_12933_cov_3.746143_5_plen_88_part_00
MAKELGYSAGCRDGYELVLQVLLVITGVSAAYSVGGSSICSRSAPLGGARARERERGEGGRERERELLARGRESQLMGALDDGDPCA